MSIKKKVALGVLFLFVLMLTIGGVGIYYLKSLARDSRSMLTDNYESLDYSRQVLAGIDAYQRDHDAALRAIESSLEQQELNITESGERDLTRTLRSTFERIKNNGASDSLMLAMRGTALSLQDINMKAIVRKNEEAQQTSDRAATYLIIIATVCALVAFTFIINFPGYIANPIARLTESIKSIAGKNYEERLHFDRRDEFEQLAEAFNLMAEKLDEYEHSNLSKILFEKKRIEALINRINDPLIGLDESNRVVFANDRALGLLNLSSPEIIDRYAPDIAVNNDLFRNLIRDNNKPAEGAASLIKAVIDGKENYFSRETISIEHKATGEKVSVRIGEVIMLRNVTPYKELDLAKTNFIATISHELKTPIASLQMCARLLQDQRVGTLNAEQANIANTLTDEIARLTKITNELLDLSQVETGNIKLNIRKTTARDVIDLAVSSVKFQAERRQVSIAIDQPNPSPIVQADVDKTTWVLVNFLTNAIRYSADNDTLLLRCAVAGGSVSFTVTDRGPGIERKHLARIFEKFYQVPGTPGGTGLGLAISKEFIEAQGGSIRASSEPGHGSEFSFSLPAAGDQ